jgi:hypothetical protein
MLLSASPSFAADQEFFFKKVAASIVACYQKSGAFVARYNEEGYCDDSMSSSAWTLPPAKNTEAVLRSFNPLGQGVVGSYDGTVTVDLVLYTGEDITAVLTDNTCLPSK